MSEFKRTIGATGFFTLAFGATVGSGWLVVLGHWLARGGPGGTILGFLVGGATMVLIGLCYAELTSHMPRAGGELLYAHECLGPAAGFFVGWFLALKMVAVLSFEGIALGLLIRELIPGIDGRLLYVLLEQPITAGGLTIGVVGAVLIGGLNLSGAGATIRFQNVATFSFIAITIGAAVVALASGSLANMSPVFPNEGGIRWWQGTLWVFSLSGIFLNGFQAALHAIEERRETTTLRKAVLSMVAGIAAAAAFYGLIVLAASSAAPWRSLLSAELPASAAFSASMAGGALGTVVLAAGVLSLVKTWNAVAVMASRLVFAQARLGYLPQVLATISSRTGIPTVAVTVVTVLSIVFLPLGRGAILPIINMCSVCLALSYVLCLWILIRLRRQSQGNGPLPGYRVPGRLWPLRIAFSGAIIMAGTAIVEPAFRRRAVPLEWFIMGTWALCGALMWRRMRGRRAPIVMP